MNEWQARKPVLPTRRWNHRTNGWGRWAAGRAIEHGGCQTDTCSCRTQPSGPEPWTRPPGWHGTGDGHDGSASAVGLISISVGDQTGRTTRPVPPLLAYRVRARAHAAGLLALAIRRLWAWRNLAILCTDKGPPEPAVLLPPQSYSVHARTDCLQKLFLSFYFPLSYKSRLIQFFHSLTGCRSSHATVYRSFSKWRWSSVRQGKTLSAIWYRINPIFLFIGDLPYFFLSAEIFNFFKFTL